MLGKRSVVKVAFFVSSSGKVLSRDACTSYSVSAVSPVKLVDASPVVVVVSGASRHSPWGVVVRKRTWTVCEVPSESDIVAIAVAVVCDISSTLTLVPSPADIGTSIRNELNSGHHTARMFPNMSASKYRVELTESQKRRLSEVAHRGKSPARTVKRALALLKADEGQIDNRIADALSISRRTVVRIRKRFCEEGLESALVERARPGQKRKLDERAEAHLVAIACSDPPEGHAHWTLKLLADKAVELGYVESIARETMRQSLKKTNLSRGRTRRGASRN